MRMDGVNFKPAMTRIAAVAMAALLAACGGGGGGSTSLGGGTPTPPPPPPPATPGVSLLAGFIYGNPYVDATGTAARFNQPGSIAVDSLGNVWVEDVDPSVSTSFGDGRETTLRVVSPTGVVTTAVRNARPTAPVNGDTYSGLVADAYGNVYEVISGGSVPSSPTIGQPYSTLNPAVPAPNLLANRQCQGSGTSQVCYFAMNRQGTLFAFSPPQGTTGSMLYAYSAGQAPVAIANSGYMPPSYLSTFIDGGPSTAVLNNADGVVFGANNSGYFIDVFGYPAHGSGYFSETGIRSFTQQGNVFNLSTLIIKASGGMAPFNPQNFVDGASGVATINAPSALHVDGAGNIYFTDLPLAAGVTDYSHSIYIRKMTPTGSISTVVGPLSGFGNIAGPSLTFDVDSNGNIYVLQQQQLLKIAPGGKPTPLAGIANATTASQDGAGNQARFAQPLGVTADTAGNTYVADCAASTVRKIDSSGNTTTLAGVTGQAGSADGVGSAARFTCPSGIVADGLGNVYVNDKGGLREINTSTGAVTTVGPTRGLISTSIAVDANGKIYTNDIPNNAFRVYDPKSQTFTFLAQGAFSYTGYFTAVFSGLTVDAQGNLYALHPVDGKLRKISQQGNVSNLPGAGGAYVFPPNAGITIDASGNLYVTDPANHVIREVAPDGTMTIVAGTPGITYAQAGTLPSSLGTPVGIALRPGTTKPQFVVSDQNAILSIVTQ